MSIDNGRSKLTGLERTTRRARTADISRRGVLKGAAGAAGGMALLQETAESRSLQSATPIPSDPPSAQAPDFPALAAAQNAANSKPGPRSVPARVIPVPTADLSAEARAWAAAPYGAGFDWNANPRTVDEWRGLVRGSVEASLGPLAEVREALGVSMEETTLGGVTCYVLTPRAVPEAHRNHLVVNAHGGGYVYGPGVSGTGEAALLAAFGGYEVLAFDYRMPPDAPTRPRSTTRWRSGAKSSGCGIRGASRSKAPPPAAA